MPAKKSAKKDEQKAADPAPVADHADADEKPQELQESCCSDQLSQLILDLDKLAKITRGLANTMKKVKKVHDKEVKNLEKVAKGKKKKPRDPNAPKRAPSGFNKPAPLSKELCKFLGVDAKTELSRPDVTKRITKYIKDHNLQNDSNKREILPDKKLGKLLSGPTDDSALTFFNLQKYIKHHFPKPNAASN